MFDLKAHSLKFTPGDIYTWKGETLLFPMNLSIVYSSVTCKISLSILTTCHHKVHILVGDSRIACPCGEVFDYPFPATLSLPWVVTPAVSGEFKRWTSAVAAYFLNPLEASVVADLWFEQLNDMLLLSEWFHGEAWRGLDSTHSTHRIGTYAEMEFWEAQCWQKASASLTYDGGHPSLERVQSA